MPAAPNIPTLPLTGSLLSTLQPETYLAHHLSSSDIRPTTSRAPHETRSISCTTGSLSHCAGSSLIRVGNTTIVCGIQPEILQHDAVPDPPRERLVPPRSRTEEQVREQEDIASLGLLVPNIELNTGCSPTFLPGEGRAPGQLQQTLCVRLLRLLLATRLVQLSDLTIRRGRGPQSAAGSDGDSEEQEVVGYWVLYISLLPLSLDGTDSAFDAMWLALLAALRDVRLPRAWWDADREGIICSDYADEATRLKLRGQPVALTTGVFAPGPHLWTVTGGQEEDEEMDDVDTERRKRWLLVDPDGFEDILCYETITAVVDGKNKTRILAMEKSGGGSVAASDMRQLVEAAAKRWQQVARTLPAG